MEERERLYPGTRIADVEMVSTLLGGELGADRLRDPVAERALLALELTRRIAGLDPVRDLASSVVVVVVVVVVVGRLYHTMPLAFSCPST